MNHDSSNPTVLPRNLGTWQVAVAGMALVVAASTLVSDFSGFFTLGSAFVAALGLAFLVNLLLAISAADLSATHPRAGALYHYAREILRGRTARFVSVFLSLSFFGMFALAISGETSAGAYALNALCGFTVPHWILVLTLGVIAVIPNLFGIRTMAWVSAVLLLLMIGIRWFFGISGFLGWSTTGAWSAANLANEASPGLSLLGDSGILTAGFAIAFWSFVGIEFACSLGEEVREPRKAMPRGMILGLLGILATSLVMGLGVTGTQPLAAWQAISTGTLAAGGDAPQLAVGHAMFGQTGYLLMAIASLAATLGSLTVAYAAMPRILFSIARDENFFGPLGRSLRTLHPRTGTPIVATLATFALYQIAALTSGDVLEWIYSAAYAWILLYLAFHALAFLNARRDPSPTSLRRVAVPVLGFALTAAALYFSFAGAHAQFGLRALAILGGALLLTGAGSLKTIRKAAPVKSPALNPVS